MVQSTVSAQTRIRASSLWTPTPPTMMQTRPLRSSPLAGPAFFSTLPTIISESSEESHSEPHGESLRGLGHTRSQSSSSVVSQAPSGSGYGTGGGSGHGSIVVEGQGSTSSISLSTTANGTASSQGHGNSLNPKRPARLSKSPGSKGFFSRATSPSEPPVDERSVSSSLAVPPRARTTSGHSRSASLPTQHTLPQQDPSIPQAYSPTSSRPTSPASSTSHLSVKSNHLDAKQPPSTSRDPASNWMSSSPFGPAMTPKFSRLALGSSTVVMPLSAKEYRKKKAKEAHVKGKEKDLPTPPHHTTSTDVPISRVPPPQAQNISLSVKVPDIPSEGAPLPYVSRPASTNQLRSGQDSETDPRDIPLTASTSSLLVSAVIHPASLRPSKLSAQPRPSSPKKSHSRPNTPPRSSLSAQPLISPKSSTNTFFSCNSSSEDEVVFPLKDTQISVPDSLPSAPSSAAPGLDGLPPARPRPRPRRRKSFPERLSNGAMRLSLLEAVNRLSQEGSPNLLSPKNSMNRLSTMSQASGNTLFYDFSESEKDESGREQKQGHAENDDAQNPRVSVLYTQSLEELSSTLARTGIEVVERDLEEETGPTEDGQKVKGKRNVRVVRISDKVEVSPPPVTRRRKLTKSRPPPPPAKEQKPQTHERRTSLLPWRSKGSGDGKIAVVGGVDVEKKKKKKKKKTEDGRVSTPTTGLGSRSLTTPPPVVEDTSPCPEHRLAFDDSLAKGTPSGSSTPMPEEETSTPPRRGRRYTFQFVSAPSFHLPKREKSKTEPIPVYMDSSPGKKGMKKGGKGSESGFGTDSTGTSTVTQGSQSTLTPVRNGSAHSSAVIDLTIVTPPKKGDDATPDLKSLVRRETAKAMGAITPSESIDSTPSLTTNGSTATSSSAIASSPSVVRLHGETFVPRPSTLKESFTDTSEEDSEGAGKAKIYGVHHSHHHRQQSGALLTATDTSEEDGKVHRQRSPTSRPGTGSSTLTTVTTASYVSFSTMPASTTTSASSSSISLIPSTTEELIPVEKRNPVVHAPVHADIHHCAHCGHLISQVPSAVNTQERERPTVSPLSTVPLVTIPAPTVSRTNVGVDRASRSGSTTPTSRPHSPFPSRMTSSPEGKSPQSPVTIVSTPAAAWQQPIGTRKNDKHNSVPVSAAHAPSPALTKLNPSTLPRAVLANGRPSVDNAVLNYSPEWTMAMTSGVSTQTRRQRRPQTAPAGSGDAALMFIEAARLQAARTDMGNGFGSHIDQGAKEVKLESVVKSGGGESKLKSVLKGWLKRS